MNNEDSRAEANTAGNSVSDSSADKRRTKKDQLDELADLIAQRAESAHPTLKAMLAGSVELFIRDRPFRVLFDFCSNPPKRLASGSKEGDCIIETDEKTFLRIHNGDLNPQLAMVSDKITIKGRSGLAVYFFNLLGD